MADPERIGPYRIIQRLGAGGMGEVVLAHDDRLDRLVAIKRLHDTHAATPARRERFRREARIVARLDHPAIVQIHDVFHQGDHDYLIMEYVAGTTLRERCAAGPITVSELLTIAHQIALGMAAAHDLGVVHRDLKAENVLITRAGRAKITDFGIAKLHGEDPLTSEGAVVGTFHAMSPEQALGRAVDHRSDLFSFGSLMYESLAGESPFHAETPFLIVKRLVMDDPRPIRELVPAIPHELASLIHQLLAKEPLLRPRDFHEVADALIELAGEACDVPCRAGASTGGHSHLGGDDRRRTDDSFAPVRPPSSGDPELVPDGAGCRDPGGHRDRSSQLDTNNGRPAAARAASRAAAPAVSRAASGAAAPAVSRAAARAASGLGRARIARRRVRADVAAIAIALAGAVSIGYAVLGEHPGREPRASHLSVAVLAPSVVVAADRPEIALLAVAVRNSVMAGVRARKGLDLVPRGDIDSYVDGVLRDTGRPPMQRAIRTAVGADEVIATHIECLPGSCKVTLERDGNPAGGPPPESFQLAADNAGHPGDTIAVHLSRLYPDHPVRDAGAGSLDPRDHERYIQLVQDYWAGGTARSTDELLVELSRIRERSPRFIDALLFEAEVLRHRYLQTQDPDQATRAIELLRDADRRSPDTYDILSARFDIVLSAGRLDEASAVLTRLVTLDPDSSTTHLQRAKLHLERGELAQARGELDDAARRDSFSWRVPYSRARVFKRLGDPTATRAAIDQLLARSPGNYAGLSLLAREELDAGRLACAEQIYALLVEREPLYDECLSLGYTRTQLGRYRNAVDNFHCALAIRPADPSAQLNLAEALLLSGDTDGAGAQLRALHQSLIRKRQNSPDGVLTGVDLLIEAQTLAYLGRDDPTLAAAARAQVAQLLTSAARPDSLYTAALVHAFLGDRDLATRYLTEYLDGGNNPADLNYPWFDDLRRDPVLGPRLASSTIAQTCGTGASP